MDKKINQSQLHAEKNLDYIEKGHSASNDLKEILINIEKGEFISNNESGKINDSFKKNNIKNEFNELHKERLKQEQLNNILGINRKIKMKYNKTVNNKNNLLAYATKLSPFDIFNIRVWDDDKLSTHIAEKLWVDKDTISEHFDDIKNIKSILAQWNDRPSPYFIINDDIQSIWDSDKLTWSYDQKKTTIKDKLLNEIKEIINNKTKENMKPVKKKTSFTVLSQEFDLKKVNYILYKKDQEYPDKEWIDEHISIHNWQLIRHIMSWEEDDEIYILSENRDRIKLPDWENTIKNLNVNKITKLNWEEMFKNKDFMDFLKSAIIRAWYDYDNDYNTKSKIENTLRKWSWMLIETTDGQTYLSQIWRIHNDIIRIWKTQNILFSWIIEQLWIKDKN